MSQKKEVRYYIKPVVSTHNSELTNPDKNLIKTNDFYAIKSLLESYNINFDIKNDILSISYDPETVKYYTTRNAGRKPKRIIVNSTQNNPETNQNKRDFNAYKYSDIVYMAQSMNDKELFEYLSMPRPTFYRHKKKLLESSYFEQLDRTRFEDLDYLRSVPGDTYF